MLGADVTCPYHYVARAVRSGGDGRTARTDLVRILPRTLAGQRRMRGNVTWRDGLHGHDDAVASESADAERLALRSRIDLAGLPPLTRTVTEQVIGTSADLAYANDLVCSEPWLEAAVGALAAGAAVVADGPMVAAGLAAGSVICKIGESLTERLARTAGIARAAAAVRLAYGDAGPGAVWVVGSEPVAIYEILSRSVQPALVIGMPAASLPRWTPRNRSGAVGCLR